MTILSIHVAATLFMTGLIWFVQIVHYPLLARVGREGFVEYEAAHARLTTLVVGPIMLLEAATGVLVVLAPPAELPSWSVWSGAGLILVIWTSTAFLQVPQHRMLTAGFDCAAHRRLVSSNWLRTAAWTARACLVSWMATIA